MSDLSQFNTAFIIGNGESRQCFDLEKLRRFGITYGCNALYRDFVPDVLVSIDASMGEEIRQSGYTNPWLWKAHPEWLEDRHTGQRFRFRRMHPCGIMAVPLAIEKHPQLEIICLLGFDLGLVSRQRGVINAYKGTPNYKGAHTMNVLAPRWSGYLKNIFAEFPKVQFVRVGPMDDMIPEWQDIPSGNVWYLDYLEFENDWLKKTKFVE